ncbi:hypothetical protein SFC65_20000 [Priestia filamentosa]|uniref:hypothetical protein n=1 Tax=Priestia filamentosa TaxID=1402861 RepID=UPI003981E28F
MILAKKEEILMNKFKVTQDNIDQYIEEWRDSKRSLSVPNYLGMSREEYKTWMETNITVSKAI